MRNLSKKILFIGTMALFLFACKKNKSADPKPDTPLDPGAGESENITRVALYLTNPSTSKIDTVEWKDVDGDGIGNPPVIDSLILLPNTTYNVQLKIFDDTKNPADTISHEVEEEADNHIFHYTFTPKTANGLLVTTSILDKDKLSPALPLGLNFDLTTNQNSGEGSFQVVLRHFGPGLAKTTNPSDGEEDLKIAFPTKVEILQK